MEIKIRSKIKRGTRKCEMHPMAAFCRAPLHRLFPFVPPTVLHRGNRAFPVIQTDVVSVFACVRLPDDWRPECLGQPVNRDARTQFWRRIKYGVPVWGGYPQHA